MKRARGFGIYARKRWFKPPIISITDGVNEIIFEGSGSFTIETNKKFPLPILKKDYF